MRDAFGGLMNIVIIVFFLVLVSGYLAFNVNYTKAFRVKNKIISTLEEYEGNCNQGSTCDTKILEYMKTLGYSTADPSLSGKRCVENSSATWKCMNKGYCVCEVDAAAATNDTKKRVYFKVVTQINIDIPIINKIMPGLRVFQVSGDTKPIVVGR